MYYSVLKLSTGFEMAALTAWKLIVTKAIIKAPIGVPIVEESTFNERTLWAPRSKTPIFILVFANLIILAMWGIIIYLITNLFRINKTKI